MLIGVSITQPDKIHLQETDDPHWADMLALLRELREVFAAQAKDFDDLLQLAVAEGQLSQVASLHRLLRLWLY